MKAHRSSWPDEDSPTGRVQVLAEKSIALPVWLAVSLPWELLRCYVTDRDEVVSTRVAPPVCLYIVCDISINEIVCGREKDCPILSRTRHAAHQYMQEPLTPGGQARLSMFPMKPLGRSADSMNQATIVADGSGVGPKGCARVPAAERLVESVNNIGASVPLKLHFDAHQQRPRQYEPRHQRRGSCFGWGAGQASNEAVRSERSGSFGGDSRKSCGPRA